MRPRHIFASTILLLALASCSAEPAAPPPLTPSTGSPTTAPTQHAETAEEFIRRWEAAGDAMQLDGDTKLFRSLSKACQPCNDFADTVDRIYRHGGHIEYSGTKIPRITQHHHLAYDVRVVSGPTDYTESKGGPVQHLDGGAVTMRVFLDHTATGWQVTETAQLAGSAS